jgi:hypothetical protein
LARFDYYHRVSRGGWGAFMKLRNVLLTHVAFLRLPALFPPMQSRKRGHTVGVARTSAPRVAAVGVIPGKAIPGFRHHRLRLRLRLHRRRRLPL